MPKFSNILIIVIITGIIATISPWFWLGIQSTEANSAEEETYFAAKNIDEDLFIVQDNSLAASGNISIPAVVTRKIKVMATGYSSCPTETDDTPFITANGTHVKDGIVANNLLPFGTQIRIPEFYGDKIFTVEDRMHWRKGYYHVDIWFSEKEKARNFGAKLLYIEVLEG